MAQSTEQTRITVSDSAALQRQHDTEIAHELLQYQLYRRSLEARWGWVSLGLGWMIGMSYLPIVGLFFGLMKPFVLVAIAASCGYFGFRSAWIRHTISGFQRYHRLPSDRYEVVQFGAIAVATAIVSLWALITAVRLLSGDLYVLLGG